MKIVIAGLIGLMLSVGARAESEVSGQVRFAGGEPVGGADVMLFDVSDEQLGVVAKTTTDEAGQFVLALTAAGSAQPMRFSLGQSYPNPFNPSTIIPYELAEAARVRLDVFNLLGQRVTTLVDDEQVAGSYTARWDARDASGQGVASGVYLYRLTAAFTSSADEVMATRRMVLVDGSAGAVLPGGAVGAEGSVAETVDVIEAVEAPVYGLAVEVEGLKTYVDSAFVVGAGPVDVVLETSIAAGRGKLASNNYINVKWEIEYLSGYSDEDISKAKDRVKKAIATLKCNAGTGSNDVNFLRQGNLEIYKISSSAYDCFHEISQTKSHRILVKSIIKDMLIGFLAVKTGGLGLFLHQFFDIYSTYETFEDIFKSLVSANLYNHSIVTLIGELSEGDIVPEAAYLPLFMVRNGSDEKRNFDLTVQLSGGYSNYNNSQFNNMGTIKLDPKSGYFIIPKKVYSFHVLKGEVKDKDKTVKISKEAPLIDINKSKYITIELKGFDILRSGTGTMFGNEKSEYKITDFYPRFTSEESDDNLVLDATASILPENVSSEDIEYTWSISHPNIKKEIVYSGPESKLKVPLSKIDNFGRVDCSCTMVTLKVEVEDFGINPKKTVSRIVYFSDDGAGDPSPPDSDIGDDSGEKKIEITWFDPGDPGSSSFGSLDDLISDINSSGDDTGGGTSGEPDLIVKYPRAERSSSPGAIDIYATVSNEGTGKSNGTILRYYNSNNKSIHSGASELQPSVSVSSLDPGGEDNKMASFNSPGVWQYYFGACVDAVDLESNTSNNCSDGVGIDDHGATRETATEVSLDTTISGYLSAGDVDYFKVDIGFQLGKLTAYTTGNIDTYGRIEVPNGTLAKDDDSGDGFNFKVTDNVSLGPNYIKVEGRKIGDYQLHLSSKVTKP